MCVPVPDLDPPVVRSEANSNFLGYRNGAVPPARASYGYGHVAATLSHELVFQKEQERFDAVQVFNALLLAEDVLLDLLIPPALVTQGVYPEGVGQETEVEHHVRIERDSVLVTEGDHAYFQKNGSNVVPESAHQLLSQFMDVALGCIYYDVGAPSQGLQHPALAGDAFADAAVGMDRMGAPRLLETPYKGILVGLEEYDAIRYLAPIQFAQRFIEIFEELAAADIDNRREMIDFVVPLRAQLDHLENEGWRQVIDTKIAKILEALDGY
jgi:hypothetical protein